MGSIEFNSGGTPRQRAFWYSDGARELEDRLNRWTAIAEKTIAAGGGEQELGEALLALDDAEIAVGSPSEETIQRYRRLCPIVESSTGLHRYVAKRQA